MAKLLKIVSVCLVAGLVNANPVQRRGVIAHDAVVGFKQTVPAGTYGNVLLAYQPRLYVKDGCVPYPAVDAAGSTSGGLATSGSSSGGCGSSPGQIYARGKVAGNGYAIMYSWFMPKDSPSNKLGHRFDWEGTLVFLKSDRSTTADNIVAVCPSAHGGWQCATKGFTLSGTSPLIEYHSNWPTNHECGLTSTPGGQQPLIAWESLPAAAKNALTTTNFGSAIVPFIDAKFSSNIAGAKF